VCLVYLPIEACSPHAWRAHRMLPRSWAVHAAQPADQGRKVMWRLRISQCGQGMLTARFRNVANQHSMEWKKGEEQRLQAGLSSACHVGCGLIPIPAHSSSPRAPNLLFYPSAENARMSTS